MGREILLFWRVDVNWEVGRGGIVVLVKIMKFF